MIYTFLLLSVVSLTACGPEQASAPAEQAQPPPAEPVATQAPSPEETRIDPVSGLVIDEGWELVRGTCAACHSASLVTQNRGSRETWKDMIVWMQESQGLWPLDPQTEGIILDYLAKNYPPAASSRRAPLPAEMLPTNPYDTGSP